MIDSKPNQTTTRRIPKLLIISLLLIVVVSIAILNNRLMTPSVATPATAIAMPPDATEQPQPTPLQLEGRVLPPIAMPPDATDQPQAELQQLEAQHGIPLFPPRGQHSNAMSEADGVVADGTTVFDQELAGVGKLNPALLEALQSAATDAADGGIIFFVTSGWRSPQYQNQLLHEAIATYGSEEEAARWVASPETSPHVSGEAVDIGMFDAIEWLAAHGSAYGLCQIYLNEPWHYELRPSAIEQGCPPMYTDPTDDPRMQP